MKKLLLVSSIALLGFAYAADPLTVTKSAEPLVGALENTPDFQAIFISTYIPEYGLQLTGTFGAFNFTSDLDIQPGIDAIRTAITGLSAGIQGLEDGDWVSVSATFSHVPNRYATIRLKPNQPDSLEVWVDGVKQ